MDIAATGLALPLLGPVRDRPQARPDTAQPSSARNDRDTVSRGTPASSDGRNERVVRGEVIFDRAEPSRSVNPPRRDAGEGATAFTYSGSRRFSIQAAVQTFRDNEALVAEPGQARQVSGIIDEYV